jgi:hypothetical protein
MPTLFRVFFRGSYGQLVENDWFPAPDSNWRWSNPHEPLPDGTQMVSAPASYTLGAATSVFVQGANGQLYQRELNLDTLQWAWIPHGLPPAVVGWFGTDGVPRMIVAFQGANGALIGRYWHRHDGWQWNGHNAPHGFPPGTQMSSAPAIIRWTSDEDGITPRLNVFIQGADGSFVETYWDGDDWLWNNHGQPLAPGWPPRPPPSPGCTRFPAPRIFQPPDVPPTPRLHRPPLENNDFPLGCRE